MSKTQSGRRINAIVILAAVLICLYASLIAGDIIYAAQENSIDVKNSEDLTITIVDDEAMVMDQNVPLASGPSDNNFAVHAVLGGILLAVVLIYVIYFHRYQKRIFSLRQKLADEEAQAMRR